MFKPLLAMILLTFIVWAVMYWRRLGEMARRGISPRSVSTSQDLAQQLSEWTNRPADNLKNLFEMPVVFYVVSAVSLARGLNDPWLVGLAWAYVALRAVHSAVHCITNHVPTRFTAYVASCLVLGAMVILWALGMA